MRDTQAQIVALALAGTPPRQIAPKLGCTLDDAYAAITRARRAGVEIPRFQPGLPPGGPRRGRGLYRVPHAARARLQAEAEARGLPDADALACRLLSIIARDDLFAALLED